MTLVGLHEDRCQAYVQSGGQPLARGGRRYRNCKRPATTERTQMEHSLTSSSERTYALCGHHAAQWDRAKRGEGYPPSLRSDTR